MLPALPLNSLTSTIQLSKSAAGRPTLPSSNWWQLPFCWLSEAQQIQTSAEQLRNPVS